MESILTVIATTVTMNFFMSVILLSLMGHTSACKLTIIIIYCLLIMSLASLRNCNKCCIQFNSHTNCNAVCVCLVVVIPFLV